MLTRSVAARPASGVDTVGATVRHARSLRAGVASDLLAAPVARRDVLRSDRGPYREAGRPLTAGGHDGPVAHEAGREDRLARRGDGHRATAAADGAAVGHHTRSHLDVHDLVRCLAAVLDLEQIGEVGIDGQRDHDVRGVAADVAQHEVLAQAVADVAGPPDQQGAVGVPTARRGAGDEGGLVAVVLDRGERLDIGSVHREAPDREDAGVRDEQPVRPLRQHVPARRRDAERCPLDEGDRSASGVQGRPAAGRPGRGHR